jgi:hypothetical protein
VDGGEWIVSDQALPRSAIVTCLSQGQPCLNVFSGRTGIVTGRQQVVIDRMADTHGTCDLTLGQVNAGTHVMVQRFHDGLLIG